jgi:hypothetical protein
MTDFSAETMGLARKSFFGHYKRLPDDSELEAYIESLLNLGLAVLK